MENGWLTYVERSSVPDTLEFALRVPYFARQVRDIDLRLLTVLETLALLVTRLAGEDVEREYRKRLAELDRTGEIPAPKGG